MKKLSYMFIMIICISTMLILNAMGIFAYEDASISAETQKNNMLNFSIKYSSLLDRLRNNSIAYIETNDEKNKTDFFSLRNEYLYQDNISLNYQTFTHNQATQKLKETIAATGFHMKTQADYLEFTKSELETYYIFLHNYNLLIQQLTKAINSRDMSVITSSFYGTNGLYEMQLSSMDSLCKSYIDRVNISEDLVLKNQNILEVTLILLTLLLLVLSSITFNIILRENRHNSYFRQLYNTVVENSNVGICILDQDHRYEYMNSMYKEIMCVNSENPMGKTYSDLFNQNIVEIMDKISSIKGKQYGEVDIIIENQKKHISYNCFIIKDENGNRKSVHLIQDYTATDMMQSQLLKQLKEIEFYSQAKDTFIANISHEIKTPINAVLGMVHFLKSTKLSENQKKLVSKIETSSDILMTIINDVLDLSKIKNNSLSLYPSDFLLAQVITDVEDMFSNQLEDKGLTWHSDYDFSKNLCIHLDKTRFVQILINLINNGIKFTDKGFVKLSVDVLYESNEYVSLQFCIEDSGIGIAEKDISKLFHEFEQLDNHLTKLHQGTGLGLYICKSIIDSMGGRMWVKSTKGEGSKFYFSIHAEKAFLAVHINPVSNESNSIPFNGTGSRALVVEDTEINLDVAVQLLNDVNVTCDTATDGLEAIKMCSNKEQDYYNLILMDIHMPNMDGYTAAFKLKNELGIKSPIVALTASDINDQIREEQKGIIDRFILKPFKVSAFYKTLSIYFNNPNMNSIDKTIARSIKDIELDPECDLETFSEMIDLSNPFAGRAEAIKNIGGSESIYNKHVEKFKVNYVNSTFKIKALLDDKEFEEARRLAHSIKGLGGTLGMLNMQSTATALEIGILKGEGYDLSEELAAFEEALRAVISHNSSSVGT